MSLNCPYMHVTKSYAYGAMIVNTQLHLGTLGREIPREVPQNVDLTGAMHHLVPMYYNVTHEIHY